MIINILAKKICLFVDSDSDHDDFFELDSSFVLLSPPEKEIGFMTPGLLRSFL